MILQIWSRDLESFILFTFKEHRIVTVSGFRFQDKLNGKDVIGVEDLLGDEGHVLGVVLIVQEVDEVVAFCSLEAKAIRLEAIASRLAFIGGQAGGHSY